MDTPRKHKRIVLSESKFGGFCQIFYYCPSCGTELIGDDKYFKEHSRGMAAAMGVYDFAAEDEVKDGLTCPVCGAGINDRDNGLFLDVSRNKLAYEVLRLKNNDTTGMFDWSKGKGSLREEFYRNYGFYFNYDNSQIEVHDYHDGTDGMKWLIAVKPADEWKVDGVFECLKQVRTKRKEQTVGDSVEKIMAECEAQPIDTLEVNTASIKSDPETLKRYIEHLINLESSIYSTKSRLEGLLKLQIPIAEEASVAGYIASEAKRDELEKAKEAYKNLPGREAFLSSKPVMPTPPEEPQEPTRPEMKKAGLFNKRKIQEENEAATKEYEEKYHKYEQKHEEYIKALEQYNKQCEEYEKALEAFDKEIDKKLHDAEKAAAEKVKIAEDAVANAMKNPPETVEIQEKRMLSAEIEQAKKTLGDLVKAKNELYSTNVIFGKYRDIVALTSFYEYLVAGRCDSLEGKDGAYNIYESEIRTNQIIPQLNDVMDSLEQIKNGQYMVYSTIKGVYSNLEQLNTKTEAALIAMDQMQDDISQISKQSEVIAYNTEQAAFYAKKNKELTDALGFMVALK